MSKNSKILSKKNILLATGAAIGLHGQAITSMAATCETEEACGSIIEETKQELEEIEKETAKKEDELSAVELDIDALMVRIEKTEQEIKATTQEIKKTEKKIKNGENELKELNGEISEVKTSVSARMRLSRRLSKSNTILGFISEANSITDLIRALRVVNHFAQSDNEQMDALKVLVAEQQDLIRELKDEKELLSKSQNNLLSQQELLEKDQKALEEKRESVKEQIKELESEQISATEALQIAEEQKALLEKLAAEEEERKKQEEEEKRKQEEALQAQQNNSSNNSSNSENNSDDTDENTESNSGSSNNSGNSNNNSNSGSINKPVSSNFIIPLSTGYVTCEFGCYVDSKGIPHNGIDLGNSGNTSTPVLATASGVVFRAGWHHAYGNYVMITHNINGRVMTTVYAHMHTSPYVSIGDYVYQGQQLGTMGNSGNSFGAHLHFEIYEGYYNYPHSVNPRKYINFPARW